jgi:hypothetical protein
MIRLPQKIKTSKVSAKVSHVSQQDHREGRALQDNTLEPDKLNLVQRNAVARNAQVTEVDKTRLIQAKLARIGTSKNLMSTHILLKHTQEMVLMVITAETQAWTLIDPGATPLTLQRDGTTAHLSRSQKNSDQRNAVAKTVVDIEEDKT